MKTLKSLRNNFNQTRWILFILTLLLFNACENSKASNI